VTVSKSTHINKLNNHLTPQINQHIKKPQYGVGNSGPALGQAQKGGMVNFTKCIYVSDSKVEFV
jgi:hypothetical protein